MTTLALLALGYLGFLAFVLALLTTAKRADEAMDRDHRALRLASLPVEMLPDHPSLGRVAAEVRDALAAERVTVIVADPESLDGGVVAACLGVPGLLGSRVPVGAKAVTGALGPAEAAALGLPTEAADDAAWTFARVPLACPDGRLGAITVAARRMLAFSSGELSLIERLARHGVPEFERRRRERTPHAAV